MNFSFDMPYASGRSPVMGENIVATSQPLAVQAGMDALRQGGSALDAALAAAITLVVVEPTANGLGSDAFAIVWDGDQLEGLNASGRAPAAWTPDRFANLTTMPNRGWDSVTVPGAVSAWVALHERFGRLPFDALFERGMYYATNGYPVSPAVATHWARIADDYRSQPGYAEAFLPGGRPPRPGETFHLPELAQSLDQISRTKGKAFYEGALAEAMVAHSSAHGGAMTIADLAAHTTDWCGTLGQDFNGASVHEIPPNGQGISTLMALGILQHLGLDDSAPDSVANLHLQIEAMKLAFADTAAYVADPTAMDHLWFTHQTGCPASRFVQASLQPCPSIHVKCVACFARTHSARLRSCCRAQILYLNRTTLRVSVLLQGITTSWHPSAMYTGWVPACLAHWSKIDRDGEGRAMSVRALIRPAIMDERWLK